MKPSEGIVLPPLSLLYSLATQGRVKLYENGWLPVSRLPAPVISVGNLTTGGTGKTPLVEWVCRTIADHQAATNQDQKNVCVLTRGYGRSSSQSQVVVSNGARLLAGERESGDEPYLLAKNLIGKAAVISNSDRYEAGKWALRNLGSEVFILDDGFQHLRLARDLDIVVIDATNPWGGGQLLPAGRLREKRKGIRRADCVVITRSEQVENVNQLKTEIEQTFSSTIFVSRMVTTRFCDLSGNTIERLALSTHALAAFCGIGNPQSFFSHLQREKVEPVFTQAFADHHHYSQSDLDRLCEKARTRGATALITTAKDATKLNSLKLDLPCLVLEIKIAIDEEGRLAEVVNAVAQLLNNRG